MPGHILRVDLSSAASAFEPLAVDLGRPMLDPAQGNYRTLRNWFSNKIAEPELSADGRSVRFYVQRDGDRLLGAACESATAGDLNGKLAAPWKELEKEFHAAA